MSDEELKKIEAVGALRCLTPGRRTKAGLRVGARAAPPRGNEGSGTLSINDWAINVHQLAIEKGWWDKEIKDDQIDPELVKDKVSEKLNLIHDEISESSGEARQDRWDTYWMIQDRRITLGEIKKYVDDAWEGDENARAEIMRLIHQVGMDAKSLPTPISTMDRVVFLTTLVHHINRRYKPEGFGIELVDGIIRSLDLLEALGYDVESLMTMKHIYNKTRPYRHGNKRF
jgi:hypothetical protein